MKNSYFDKIAEYVKQRSSLSFSGHKQKIMRQRLVNRADELSLPDVEAYWHYLQSRPEEELLLLDLLTTNETSFFRNEAQFAFLKEQIIPHYEQLRGEELARSWGASGEAAASARMKLRILSLGCSTGEEPYSIAMTLLAGLRYPRYWEVSILAGDISTACLKIARKGSYDEEKLRTIPADYRRQFMQPTASGAVFTEEVKQLVRFAHLNASDIMNGLDVTATPGGFDIIFCRNLMIYFASETQQLLVDTLYRLLAFGGYLFTGDAEPLHIFDHDFASVQQAGCLIYQKLEKPTHGQSV